VALSRPDEAGPKLVAGGYGRITGLGAGCSDGEFAGAVALSPKGLAALKLAAAKHADGTADPSLAVLLEELLAQGHELRAVDIGSGWAVLRTLDDVQRIVALLSTEAARR
jgi:phosphoenolpyruvate phosphomutase